jgi:YVTN family beta-propeller protein
MVWNRTGSLAFGFLMSLGMMKGVAAAPTQQQQPQAQPPAYNLVKSIPLGPGERWDYVVFDSNQNRIYVAHGDHVTAVNASSGTIVGQIGPLPGGTHGIAVSFKDGLGFTDDGDAGIAAAFDLNSFKIAKRIVAARDADGIIYDPASRHVFVINGDSGSVSVIDPKTDAAIATIPVGAGLEAGDVDGRGKFFVDGAEKHDIVVIDTATNKVVAHYPMPGCERPHGIAIDPVTRRVFATCINKIMVVVDADTGTNVATLPIGMGSDGAAFDARRKLALSSNGEGTLSVVREIDADHFVALPSIITQRSARTIAIDPASGRLYLPAADIARIDPPETPGGRPHTTYVPGSLRLLVFDPAS